MNLRALGSAMRPAHWVKNLPVLAPLVFGHRADDPLGLRGALVATAAFCLVSSAGYLVNDVCDREADAAHPRRSQRAVAAGWVSPRAALVAASVLAVVGLAMAALLTPPPAALGVAGYLVLTTVYSLRGKRHVVLGPVLVASGFVVRVLVGALAVPVVPSPWLLALTALLAAALVVAKREAERRRQDGEAPCGLRRATDGLLLLAGLVYTLYTLAPGPVAHHGTRALLWTALPVGAALLRFRARLRADSSGAGPADVVVSDPVLLALGAGWAVMCVFVLG